MDSKYHIQFQKGLSLPDFLSRFGSREQCEKHLELKKWPHGFICGKCGCKESSTFNKVNHTVFECSHCYHQTSLLVGTLFERTHLPLTIWYLAIYFISEAKTGISSLDLHRKLGVNHKTAWLIHQKIMHSMVIEERKQPISGRIEMEDAYLEGKRKGGILVRGSENKQPFVAAVATDENNHPLKVKLDTIDSFSIVSIEEWTKTHIAPGSHVVTDGLSGFEGVEKTCSHEIRVTNTLSEKVKEFHFKWIDTILSNVKTSISGTFHSIECHRFAFRYLTEITYRFNRRFDLKKIFYELCDTVFHCKPITARKISTC